MAAARPDPQEPEHLTPPGDGVAAVAASSVNQAEAALGGVFVSGMIWGTLGLGVSKLSTLLATVALGWIFGSAEYGLYAAALGAAMIGDVLTDGGLRRVLITRGAEYDRIARTAFYVALGFNCLGCLLMVGSTTLYRDRPEAAYQLVVIAVSLVLSTCGTVQRSRQSIDMAFRQIAFMGAVSSVLRNLFTVVFAACGLGPLAFALPLIVVNIWEACFVWRTVGRVPRAPLDGRIARDLIGQGKWVILATIGGSLVYRGDYLIASWLLRPTDVFDAATGVVNRVDITGQYLFGFQLTLALFSPFSVGLAAVIQPVMARLRTDAARQAAAFLRMVRTSVFVAAPASLVAVLITPLLIHLLWQGRWDAVIPVVQIIAASECIRQLQLMCLATLDSRGFWKRSATLVLIDGLCTVAAAAIGCLTGSLLGLAVAVGIQRTLTAVAQAIDTYRLLGGPRRHVLVQVLPPVFLAAAIVLGMGVICAAATDDPAARRWLLAATSVPGLVVYLSVSRVTTPLRWNEAAELIRSRLR